MRLINADSLAEIFADRMELIAERYGVDSSEAGILSGAYKLLESMPTITTEPQWIPCGERLPRTNGVYNVTRKISDGFECRNISDSCYYDGGKYVA